MLQSERRCLVPAAQKNMREWSALRPEYRKERDYPTTFDTPNEWCVERNFGLQRPLQRADENGVQPGPRHFRELTSVTSCSPITE